MRILRLVIVWGLILSWLIGSSGNIKASEPTVGSILAKWEEASQKCKTLDAKLTVWTYDGVFGNGQPTIKYGRFYYEAPNQGRYEIWTGSKIKTNDWSTISEAFIWSGKETLQIDGRTHHCTKYVISEELQSVLNGQEATRLGWLQGIFALLSGPRQAFPLLMGVTKAEVTDRFDVTIKENGKRLVLKAIPRHEAGKAHYHEVDVMLDPATFLTVASQVFSPNGRDRVVYELSEPKINQQPGDRDQLMAPDLFGFNVSVNLPPPPFSREGALPPSSRPRNPVSR